MARLHAVAALAVLYSSMAAGALLAQEPGGEAKEGSPEAAARQFVEALKNQDRKSYDAVVAKSAIADSLFEFASAGESFKKKMIKAYGEVGWNNFQDSEGARITLLYHDDKLEQLKFEVDGETAKAVLPEEGGALLMTRKEGRWQLDLEKSIDSEAGEEGMSAKALAEAFGKMAKIIRENEPKIGDGTTVDQLDKEMGAGFFAALLSQGAKPKVTVQVK